MSTRLEQSDITSLRAQIDAGMLSAEQVAAHFVARFMALDQGGPGLRSVIELNPQAADLARQADIGRPAQPATGGHPGALPSRPLAGVAVLIKDNIDTADQMSTTAGSLALANCRPARDAFVVQRLRQAGALILGKTNLTEWANYRGRGSTGGWSGRGGQTRNPYVLDRTASGSSSGAAVAVAAGLCTVAVGTETNGSIVSPASVCGIVGLKPTLGLVSRRGIIPLAASFDTAGPMARCVADTAALLSVVAGVDPEDPATLAQVDRSGLARMPDYRSALDAGSLKGARLGVLRRYTGHHEALDQVFEQALANLRSLGATCVDPVDTPLLGEIAAPAATVMRYEFKAGIDRYLMSRIGPGPKSLADLIRFNDEHPTLEMPYFGQSFFLAAQATGPLTDIAYREALATAQQRAGTQGLDVLLRAERLDALIAPTTGPAGVIDWVLGDRSVGAGVSLAPAVAGFPHLTQPMGQVHGLPVGLSWVGPRWSEARLLALAYAFERAAGGWREPRFRPTLA